MLSEHFLAIMFILNANINLMLFFNPALKHTKFKMLVDSKKEKKIDLKWAKPTESVLLKLLTIDVFVLVNISSLNGERCANPLAFFIFVSYLLEAIYFPIIYFKFFSKTIRRQHSVIENKMISLTSNHGVYLHISLYISSDAFVSSQLCYPLQ